MLRMVSVIGCPAPSLESTRESALRRENASPRFNAYTTLGSPTSLYLAAATVSYGSLIACNPDDELTKAMRQSQSSHHSLAPFLMRTSTRRKTVITAMATKMQTTIRCAWTIGSVGISVKVTSVGNPARLMMAEFSCRQKQRRRRRARKEQRSSDNEREATNKN